jgi:hypothetical protein
MSTITRYGSLQTTTTTVIAQGTPDDVDKAPFGIPTWVSVDDPFFDVQSAMVQLDRSMTMIAGRARAEMRPAR